MGFLKPKKYRSDPELEKQLKEQREKEERIKREQEEAAEKRKKRFAAGKLGTRSLFSRAGGRGFYQEGEQVD
jgi:ribosomal protein L9